MKKMILTLLTSIFYFTIIAQPGYLFQITGNLNSIDSLAIKKCIALKNNCDLNPIIIDSTTNLKRLIHLNFTPNLGISLDVTLPDYIRMIQLNKIKSLHLYPNETVDLSNLPLLDNLKILNINSFKGNELVIKNNMQSLEELTINNSENLESIDHFLQNNTISFLRLNDCKNLKLGTIEHLKMITFLSIYNSNNFLPNLERIGLFKNLESLFVKNVYINSIPKDFPRKIKSITIYDSNISFNVLIKLKKIKSLTSLKIFNSNVVLNKDK